MSTTITNYDGSVVTEPQQFIRPKSVEEIQEILRKPGQYPGPVRAMGNFHSLTPCAASTGTIVSLLGLKNVVDVDAQAMTFTAQAGLEMIEANKILRQQNLQFHLNIEIGNMTLGSAACCQTKDSLDGVELGQVNSYVTAIKWVSPSGTLEEASEAKDPELMSLMRASCGLAGIVYEVTFQIKPLEIIRFDYHVHDVGALTQEQVSEYIASNDSIVCWTVGRSVVIQTRNRAKELSRDWIADSRRHEWNFLAAFLGRALDQDTPGTALKRLAEELEQGVDVGIFRLLGATGGFALYDPDKMIDYSQTPRSARYAFTFWAFPRQDWVKNLQAYVDFAERHFQQHGFRCNMPLGSYFIRQDTHSLLSYSYDGDVISLDPIHAPGANDMAAWASFLREFNDWAHQRGGSPLLNQSPFVQKEHVVAAYGERWRKLSDWVRKVDPSGRMRNQFFEELLW